MTDTVINGTRTSRSILGNLSIPDDPAEAIALLKSTGWPIDLGPLNPAGLSQKGTDLNKANLLSDATAALYDGLPDDPTPNDVLAAIAQKLDAVNALETIVPKKIQIETGSYKGTGSASVSVYLQNAPKLFFIFSEQSGSGCVGIGKSGFSYLSGYKSVAVASGISAAVAGISWGSTIVISNLSSGGGHPVFNNPNYYYYYSSIF